MTTTTDTGQDTSRHAWVEPAAEAPDMPLVITELIAGRLAGMCLVHGDNVSMRSVVTGVNTIVVEITRMAVTGREASARVVLHLSAPPPAAAEPAPDCPAGDPACDGAAQPDPQTASHHACEAPDVGEPTGAEAAV